MVTDNTPTAAPTNAPVVAFMITLFSGWNLNEGETDTVLAVFFLVSLLVLAAIVYFSYVLFCSGTAKGPAAAGPAAEAKPLITKAAPPTGKKPSQILKERLGQSYATGFACQMYTGKGPKKVKLWLQGTDLYAQSDATFSKDQFKMDLGTVMNVEWGKRTNNIKKAPVEDDLCLSLMFPPSSSMDISVANKADRDMLALGFTEFVQKIKEGQP